MPRVRANSYDAKVKSIMDVAAALFSRTGYPGARMQDIAKACGASKSMLYHYFPSNDDLLFAMMEEHLEDVVGTLEDIEIRADDIEGSFTRFVETFIHKSVNSRQRNMIAMNEAKYLPKAMQARLDPLQKQVVSLVAQHLQRVNPNLEKGVYSSYALLLIGMLNWTDMWFKPSGALTSADLTKRITQLFLHGYLKEA